MTNTSLLQDNGLVDVIADLEGKIETLVRWARAVRDLGGCCHDVSADGLVVIGQAMLIDACEAKAGWQACFVRACDLHEIDREAARSPTPSSPNGTSPPGPTKPEGAG